LIFAISAAEPVRVPMPIQFRCHNCRQVLSITSKKAGTMVPCPACRTETRVPTMAEVEAAIAQQKRRAEEAAGGSAGAAARPAGEQRAEPRRPAEAAPPEPWASEPRASEPRAAERSASRSVRHEAATAGVARAPLPSERAAVPPEHEVGHELWEAAAHERNPWLDAEADAEEEFKLERRPLDEGGLDMTPMVDVTFLLLIFFMITAAFNVQKSMQADPPEPEKDGAAQTTTVQEQDQSQILVGISENDELTLDDAPIGGVGALLDALKARAGSGGELEMTIEADPRCTFGVMVGVMDAGITAGMQRIKRMTKPVDE